MKKPRLFTTLSLVGVLLFCFILTTVRWLSTFYENVVVVNASINSHISNFALSTLLCVMLGYLLLAAGKKYLSNVIVGLILIAANFICETVLSVLNTTDLIDAVYGLVGVLISLIYLFCIHKWGFKNDQ